MKNTELILTLMFSYAVMLLVIAGISKLKPGITHHDRLCPNNFKILNYLHAIGIAVMLIVPFMAMPLPFFLFSFPDKISVAQTSGFLICFFTIALLPWRKLSGNDHKPEYFSPFPPILLYGLLRLVFLASYEWFFRGLLLTSFSISLGITWSIIINLFLYTLVHFHKSKKEIIGCLPFGLVVCLFTVWWQSVWPAIIFHSQIAIIHEWPTLQKFISPQKQATI
jgi:membrane protease YdiL (CAAX protease family)